MLIVLGGLPGTGKTTVAREIVALLPATFLRIDTIDQSLRASGVLAGEVGLRAIWWRMHWLARTLRRGSAWWRTASIRCR
jgi:predicted kinase